jgi:hypothetical protein
MCHKDRRNLVSTFLCILQAKPLKLQLPLVAKLNVSLQFFNCFLVPNQRGGRRLVGKPGATVAVPLGYIYTRRKETNIIEV